MHRSTSPRAVLAITAAAVLALGVAACGSSNKSSSSGSSSGGAKNAAFTLNVGGVFPLTGDLSVYGPPGQKAAQLAVEQANKALQADGSKIKVKLTTADEQTDPQGAVSAARKLVSGGATCLDAAYASSDTIPVNQSVAARQGIPQISPASTSAQISTLNDNGTLFRTAPSDNLQGPELARVLSQDIGGVKGKTISLAARNDAYGTGFIDTVKTALTTMGAKVSGPVVYDPNAASYDSEAAKIVAGNPAAYVIIDFPQTYAKVGAALLRTGKFDAKKLFTADGLASATIPPGIPKAALEGARGTAPGTPKSGAASAAFNTLYTTTSGTKTRQTFDAQSFDASMLCILASVAAGSNNPSSIKAKMQEVSGPPGTKYTFQQLGQAFKDLLAGKDIDYEGASGPIDFAPNGDPTAGTYDKYQYVNGKLKIVGQALAKAGS